MTVFLNYVYFNADLCVFQCHIWVHSQLPQNMYNRSHIIHGNCLHSLVIYKTWCHIYMQKSCAATFKRLGCNIYSKRHIFPGSPLWTSNIYSTSFPGSLYEPAIFIAKDIYTKRHASLLPTPEPASCTAKYPSFPLHLSCSSQLL